MSELDNQTVEEDTTQEDVDEITTDVFDTNAGTNEETTEEAGDEIKVEEDKRRKRVAGEVRSRRKGRKPRVEDCTERKWTCEEEALWRIYMRSYAETQERLRKEDKFERRKPANLPKLPRVKSAEQISSPYKCLPLGAFQLENQTELPDKLDREKKIRIWKNLREGSMKISGDLTLEERTEVLKTDREEWPGVWPCTTRDLIGELKERERNRRRKRSDVFPCEEQDEEGEILDKFEDDFAERKELGHARVPPICPDPKKDLIDRDVGDRFGLVDGDYITFELSSKSKGTRVYTDVCLRGLKGMHLPELSPLRDRRRTWKFCFYQAIVALLAKTQLRYKYAWSANIDYIYDHAWMLFTHIGAINVRERQRLDDVVVYNYKYSVELELIQEMKDIPVIKDIGWHYEERNLKRKLQLERPELMNTRLELGCEKITDQQKAPVHKAVKEIEDWLDKLPVRYRNCVFRTTRFSLAFWKDGLFWYLYNPYRCDEFGLWDDDGYACILKFCTKNSLKRHFMILLLRAYAYTLPKVDTDADKSTSNHSAEAALKNNERNNEKSSKEDNEENNEKNEEARNDVFTVQIFHMTYHCSQIYNLQILQRNGPSPPKRLAKRKTIDDCPFDPLDTRDPCTIEQQEETNSKDTIEKPTWLKLFEITWAKCMPSDKRKKTPKELLATAKLRWHQYLVEESNKLFSLWAEIHITDGMFDKENRGMQTYACYVVCAGMTRIMAPEYWSSKTLDVIVMCGDTYYTRSKLEAEYKSSRSEYGHVGSWSRYLTNRFKIGETMFEAKVLPAICGRLYASSGRYLWRTLEQMFLKYQFGVLTCESSCLGLFKFCGAYYMCDVNSFGPPLFGYGEGAAYLMRATYFKLFMRVLILTVGSPECSQFALNPVEILRVIDTGPSDVFAGISGRRERMDKRTEKVPCPYDEEKKKRMKKWKHRRAEAMRTIDKLCCKEKD